MEWIERIKRSDVGSLVPLLVDQQGNRRMASLCNAKPLMPPRENGFTKLRGLRLNSLTLADPSEYLRAFGFDDAGVGGHEVYETVIDGQRILVPALVLLVALLSRLSAIGDRLLEPTSLDRVATPLIVDGRVRIGFGRKSELAQGGRRELIQARYKWLTCYPSATRMWHSVYRAAESGRLGLALPFATIEGTLFGRRRDGVVFATRLSIKTLVPNEAPLPFAAPHVERAFVFRFDETNAAQLERYRHARNVHPNIQRDVSIPAGAMGPRMSDAEWDTVRAELKAKGFRTTLLAKESVDIGLEKLSVGRPWDDMGPLSARAEFLHWRWVRDGQWQVLEETLNELRASLPRAVA